MADNKNDKQDEKIEEESEESVEESTEETTVNDSGKNKKSSSDDNPTISQNQLKERLAQKDRSIKREIEDYKSQIKDLTTERDEAVQFIQQNMLDIALGGLDEATKDALDGKTWKQQAEWLKKHKDTLANKSKKSTPITPKENNKGEEDNSEPQRKRLF